MRKFQSLVSPQFAVVIVTCAGVSVQPAVAQESDRVPATLIKRMADEKAARKACKIEICSAFKSPTAGKINCDVTKTWLRHDILERVVGGSYAWGYGHAQCHFKLSIDADPLSPALTQKTGKISMQRHTLVCDIQNKDPAKGKAFSIKLSVTPEVSFSDGKATSASLGSVETEGSNIAAAAVTSIMTVDKVSGLVSSAVAKEVNEFLYTKCPEEGVEVAAK